MFILHVNLHRRYYVCGGFFVHNMIVMQANLSLITSNDLKTFLNFTIEKERTICL